MVVVNGIGNLPLQVLEAGAGTAVQLLVVLHPGAGDVVEMLRQVERWGRHRSRQMVRVSASPWGARNLDLVMLLQGTGEHRDSLQVAMGSAGPATVGAAACQVALEADGDVAYEVHEWFQALWQEAAPLTTEVISAYPEWARASSSGLVDEWATFRQILRDHREDGVSLNPRALGVEDALPGDGQALPQEAEPLGEADPAGNGGADQGDVVVDARDSVIEIAKPSPLVREIKALYARGRLVTVHLSEKVPTYRLDVTEVLGQSPRSRWGRASATGSIKLDLLVPQARARVEKLRREASSILSRHSFLLDENQHWMPLNVEPHFAQRLASMSSISDLPELLGKPVAEYIQDEMETLLESLYKLLEERRTDIGMGRDEVADRLAQAAHRYLSERSKVDVRPRFSSEGLTFSGAPELSFYRPFRLLSAAAETSRKRLVNPDTNLKREAEGPPLPTLDVVGGDGLLHRERTFEVATIAERQLQRIRAIIASGPSEAACVELFSVLRDPDPEPQPSLL
ncbi:hypothetical protein GCM10009719_30150 [Nocardioides kribbensis]